MPPSVNACHLVSRGRIIKTKEARLFDIQVKSWCLKNHLTVTRIKKEAAHALKSGFQFKVICYFSFPHTDLWTKKGEAKRLDVNNRLKPCLDAVAFATGIDDKHFFMHEEEKVECEEHPHVMIAIGPIKPSFKKNLWIAKADDPTIV